MTLPNPKKLEAGALATKTLLAGDTFFRVHLNKYEADHYTDNLRYAVPEGCLYLSNSSLGAFSETFGTQLKQKFIAREELENRSLSLFTLVEDIELVSFAGMDLLTNGYDASINSGPHPDTHPIAESVFANPNDYSGIWWPARHCTTEFCVALFKDRSNYDVRNLATLDTRTDIIKYIEEYKAEIID